MVAGGDWGGDYTPPGERMGKKKTIEVRDRDDWDGSAKFLNVQIMSANWVND